VPVLSLTAQQAPRQLPAPLSTRSTYQDFSSIKVGPLYSYVVTTPITKKFHDVEGVFQIKI